MSEEIKSEPFEDEENLKTTPERQSILDYKKAKQDESQTCSKSNVDKDPDLDSNIEVKTEPQEELGLNNEVTKEFANENVIQTLVAGTTMEQEQPKTPEKVKTTAFTREERNTTALEKGPVQTSITMTGGNEVENIQNTNPLTNTCLNADNENEATKNSTPLKNCDVDVKTEPGINDNDTIDFDITMARPTTCQTIGQNVVLSQISETLNKNGTQDVSLNEPMALVDTPAGPALTSSDTEAPPPPPPPISAVLSRDPIDGTATPRITLAPMSRLRVKTELSLIQTPQSENETYTLPQDFFEDLLSVDKRSESGELSSELSEDEPIPDNFFDDLLRDKLKERIEDAQNDELEEKFSDRLKELKKLHEKSRERKKSHKKQKKSKKKSHKRSRSRSPPPSATRENHRERKKRSPSPKNLNNKRSRLTTTLQELPSTSNYGNKVSKDAGSSSTVTKQGIQVKSEFRLFEKANDFSLNPDLQGDVDMVFNPAKVNVPVVNCDEYTEVEEILTPKQRRERAMKRAASLVAHLTNMASDTNSTLSTFEYTSIVRKLPASHSYVNQQIYENRSPLHTVNNVNYKFNSHSTRFNLEEWGLATLPTQAAKIAKLIGCDALTIHNKLKTIKIPAKLQKIKSETNDQGEELIESSSSFFCNAMTQTDDVAELEQLKTKGYEIGVQVEPSVCDMGCQTLETQSPTNNNQSAQDELPIMKIMHDLNENQLMAIHDFAELIKEPAANAMDMYALRMRMLEIYKCSQLPSALATQPTQVINNYTTSKPQQRNSPPPHRRALQMQQPIIQSVSSADGTNFSINDPRAKSAAYTSRGVGNSRNGGKDSSSNYDPRYSAFAQPHSTNKSPSSSESRYSNTSPSSRHRSSATTQPATSASGKYYGRGGLRRQ